MALAKAGSMMCQYELHLPLSSSAGLILLVCYVDVIAFLSSVNWMGINKYTDLLWE